MHGEPRVNVRNCRAYPLAFILKVGGVRSFLFPFFEKMKVSNRQSRPAFEDLPLSKSAVRHCEQCTAACGAKKCVLSRYGKE